MRLFTILLTTISVTAWAQPDRWQQEADYTMEITMNVENHQFTGTQTLKYTNNSPDQLDRVFYHLFLNAFQPNSMMDVRSRNIEDPDRRVRDRISKLTPEEIGMLEPTSLKQNGQEVKYEVVGTILEVELNEPLAPGSVTTFDMTFKGQAPVQIRRTGRDNKEGIDYSMPQAYPKMVEYDYMGWHANPYVAREFYGVWGDYDVKITIDKDYVVAASGLIQNGNEVGYGYEDEGVKVKRKGKTLTYHFKAENVHDFMWAADRDYVHKKIQVPNGPEMHYFYQEDSITTKSWPELIEVSPKFVTFMNERFGKYPYPVFYVIQGGDGGMEYAMSTLVTGNRSVRSLVGVTIHEMFHSWYQGVLGSNESLHAWMDEGFTSYGSAITGAYLRGEEASPLQRSFKGYYSLVESGKQEPLTTQSDHYHTNRAYGTGAYTMGSLVPEMLGYVMGDETFEKAFRTYFNTWKFKHPNPNDFKRIMEKESGMELDWFFNDWIETTKTLDYSVESVEEQDDQTLVTLGNNGQRQMPVEVIVTLKNGDKQLYYFPLRSMRKDKTEFGEQLVYSEDWPWTHPEKTFVIDANISEIQSVEVDPSKRMGDVKQDNDFWSADGSKTE